MLLSQYFEDIAHDIRYATRYFYSARVFAIVAVLTIGLGTGANSAMFTALYNCVLAPLPYVDSDRLAEVHMKGTALHGFETGTSWSNLKDWVESSHSFEALGAHRSQPFASLTGCGQAVEVRSWRMSARAFALLGVAPSLGRGFVSEEDLAAGPHSALISTELWRRCFGQSTDVLGKRLYLEGQPFTIIGVMPAHFEFPPLFSNASPPLWLSLNLSRIEIADRSAQFLNVIGRLKPDVSIQEAQAEMDGIARQLANAYPKSNGELPHAIVRSLNNPPYAESARSTLIGLYLAGALVLLLACANVASLLIAQATARDSEFAIRASLGVTRNRLARQVITECCLLSGIGSCFGIAVVLLLMPLIRSMLAANSRSDQIALRPAVLVFTAVVSLLSGLLFGMPAILRAVKVPTTINLRSRRQSLRMTLVASEVAICLLLLTASGTALKGLWLATHVDLGFRPDHVLTMRIILSGHRYTTGHDVEGFREELLRRVAALPSVRSVGTNSAPPLGMLSQHTDFDIEGHNTGDNLLRNASFSNVNVNYFQAMGIPLLRGRSFDQADRSNSFLVTIVSASFVHHFFPDREALGQRVVLKRLSTSEPFTIVGVAGDIREPRPYNQPEPVIYALTSQLPESDQATPSSRTIVLIVRTVTEPSSIASGIRQLVTDIDKNQAVADVLTMKQMIERSLARERNETLIIAGFAILAACLAFIGVFGLVSYTVSARRHEMGIRFALGAQRPHILRCIASSVLAFAAGGLAIGTLLTIWASRLFSSILYGIDLLTTPLLMLTCTILAGAVISATMLAARKATTTQITDALRHE